jgi:SAM-dependent methyltransferase
MAFGLDLKRFVAALVRDGLSEEEACRQVYSQDDLYKPGAVRAGPLAAPEADRCPICGTAAAAFGPFGLDSRPGVQCPSCGSVERHRIMWLYLKERTDFLRRRQRVLHLAPEPCMVPHFRRHHGAGYVTLDRFNEFVNVEADMKALPSADGQFDMVLASHVLEHVAEDRPALAELGRVIAPGGRATIMVPFDPDRDTHEDSANTTPEGRLAAIGHPFHFRVYGRDLVDRLAAAGLTTEVLSSTTLFSPARRRRFRLNTNHLLACRKPLGSRVSA